MGPVADANGGAGVVEIAPPSRLLERDAQPSAAMQIQVSWRITTSTDRHVERLHLERLFIG